MKQAHIKKLKKIFNKRMISYGIFWSWNLIFGIFTAYVIIPNMLVPIVKKTMTGFIPMDFTFFAILAMLIPLAAIILGITKFRKEPLKLLKLFYGIEIPLFMICLLRIFLFRELNPGTYHLFFLLFTGIAVYLYNLLSATDPQEKYKNSIFFTGSTFLLIIGIYISIIVLFYAIPLCAYLITLFFEFEWIGKIIPILLEGELIFMGFISGLFLIFTATVFIGLPVALIVLYFKNFHVTFKNFKNLFGLKPAGLVAGIVISLNTVLFFTLNTQPQVKAFELIEKIKTVKLDGESDIQYLQDISINEKKELLAESETIRKGLLNAYLSPYRYISSTKANNHIEEIYKEVFYEESTKYRSKDKKGSFANSIQNLYNFFAQPFLYNGNKMFRDQDKAEKLYEFFFDGPIQKEEKEAIIHAMKSTWDRDSNEAGLLNSNDEKVLITKQSLSFTEHGDWAEFYLSEVYENHTIRQQEILYYFTMPENSVITGLWLSDDSTRPEKFPYVVAPRGAAQQVYKNEVRRRVDPSLLEQVGPRQYRLRAFPIPARIFRDKDKNEPEKLYLKIRFLCMADGNKSWPMPTLIERRNAYWSADTKFTINGKEFDKDSESPWLPPVIESNNQIKPAQHSFILNDSVLIKARPTILNNQKADALKGIEGKYALLIDPSYSMNKIKNTTAQSLTWIKKHKIKADIFRFDKEKAEFINIEDLDTVNNEDDFLYYGPAQMFSIVNKFHSLAAKKNYTAIIVLTDKGSYEQSGDDIISLKLSAPLYLVHQDKQIPPAYTDALLETIKKSLGGTTLSIQEVFKTISFKKKAAVNKKMIAATKGITWEIESLGSLNSIERKQYKETGAEALAASQYISRQVQHMEKMSIKELDKIHRIAKKYSLVSPYSSMIVLVNKRQKKALAEAEKKDDRFKREVEDGKEVISKPNNPFTVSGTPEPEEWMLIIIVSLFLGYMFLKRGEKAYYV
ncbi:MAG: TIGR02921 family PEP-CTERM protein [Desulfobacterales bacterium]|nr:TIGR02921 family PEP-CTERM protein [Desulfobacterales bacterium]